MVNPLTLNADPVTLACEMVTLTLPELVSVPERLLLLPTCTVPKGRLAGFDATVPAETPDPESEMLIVGFDPLLAMLMLPLAKPLACGANATVKVALWPGERVIGSDSPVRLKPLPVGVA